MIFSRKRAEGAHARDERAAGAVDAQEGAQTPSRGPYDVAEAPDEPRLDLGSLQIPAIPRSRCGCRPTRRA